MQLRDLAEIVLTLFICSAVICLVYEAVYRINYHLRRRYPRWPWCLILVAGLAGIGAASGLPGDANRDGIADSADARLVMEFAVQLADSTDVDLAAADLTGNGTVGAYDASLILQAHADSHASVPGDGIPTGTAAAIRPTTFADLKRGQLRGLTQ